MAGCYCCGNEHSVPVVGGEYFDHLSKYILALIELEFGPSIEGECTKTLSKFVL